MSKESTGEGRRILAHDEIARSNNLITARYKATLTENKMTVLALTKSRQDDYGRHFATFTAQELKQIMGHNNGSFYQQLKDTAQKMQSRQLAIEDVENKRFRYMSVIDTAEFSNGIFKVSFNVDINNYIDDLKGNFTKMNLGILVDFTSTYAYRLYEILKTQEYQIDKQGSADGEYCIYYTVAELKVAVGCVDTSTQAVREEMLKKNPDYDKIVDVLAEEKHFEKWYDFKKNVLDVAEQQINAKSDLHVRYELRRSGRGGKVQGVSIFISRNPLFREKKGGTRELRINDEISVVSENDNIRPRIDEILEYIDDYTITRGEAHVFLEHAKFNVDRVKDAYDYVRTKHDVHDFVSYMIDAIQKGYAISNRPRRVVRQDPTSFAGHHFTVDAGSQLRFDDLEEEEEQIPEAKTVKKESPVETTVKKERAAATSEEEAAAMELIESLMGEESWQRYTAEKLPLGYDLTRRVKGAKWILENYVEWKEGE